MHKEVSLLLSLAFLPLEISPVSQESHVEPLEEVVRMRYCRHEEM